MATNKEENQQVTQTQVSANQGEVNNRTIPVTIPPNLLLNLSICLSDIPKSKMHKSERNGKIYASLCVSARKEADDWGRDLKIYVSQTQEERRGGEAKIYVGGGKTVKVENTNNAPSDKEVEDLLKSDLPF